MHYVEMKDMHKRHEERHTLHENLYAKMKMENATTAIYIHTLFIERLMPHDYEPCVEASAYY